MGVEPSPVVGHLGGEEPMMKPHFIKCGLLLTKEVIAGKDYKDNQKTCCYARSRRAIRQS